MGNLNGLSDIAKSLSQAHRFLILVCAGIWLIVLQPVNDTLLQNTEENLETLFRVRDKFSFSLPHEGKGVGRMLTSIGPMVQEALNTRRDREARNTVAVGNLTNWKDALSDPSLFDSPSVSILIAWLNKTPITVPFKRPDINAIVNRIEEVSEESQKPLFISMDSLEMRTAQSVTTLSMDLEIRDHNGVKFYNDREEFKADYFLQYLPFKFETDAAPFSPESMQEPWLQDEVKDMTIEEAKNYVVESKTRERSTISVLGMSIDVRKVVLIGPFLLFAALFHLWVYFGFIKSKLEKNGGKAEFLPGILLIPGKRSGIVGFTSVGLIPTVTLAYMLFIYWGVCTRGEKILSVVFLIASILLASKSCLELKAVRERGIIRGQDT